MKRLFAIWFLSLAAALVLGHQLVPHAHSELGVESRIEAPSNSPFDILGQLFSLDQGADHLEHIRLIQQNSIQLGLSPKPIDLAACLALAALPQQLEAIKQPSKFYQLTIVEAPLLRGPPAQFV